MVIQLTLLMECGHSVALGGDVTQDPLGPDVHWEHSKALCISEISVKPKTKLWGEIWTLAA